MEKMLTTYENTAPQEPEMAEQNIERQLWLDSNAPVLGKWLWLLFWLVIPNLTANMLSNDNLLGAVPLFRIPGEILSFLCSFAYAWILWQLRSVWNRYGKAAVAGLISAVVSALSMILLGDGNDLKRALLALVILLPMMGVSLYATYQEYHAHAAVLEGLNDELAEKWKRQWKLEVISLCAVAVSLLIVLFAPILGMIIMLAAAVCLLVVGIRKMIYLYRTAQIFRDYTTAMERRALPDETSL